MGTANPNNPTDTSSSADETKTGGPFKVTQAKGRTPDGMYHTFMLGTPTGAYYGRVPNKNKVVNLYLYRYASNEFLKGDLPAVIESLRDNNKVWDNWKKGESLTVNGQKTILMDVPKTVLPVTDDLKIEGGFQYGTISASEAMKQGGGAILGTVKASAKDAGSFLMSVNAGAQAIDTGFEGLAKGDYAGGISLAENAMKTTKNSGRSLNITSKIDNVNIYNGDETKYTDAKSLKLSFDFGCGGFYDGEIEVVRPIMALVAALAPHFDGINDESGAKHRLALPGANPAQFYAATWGGTIGAGADALTSILSGAKEKEIAGDIKGGLGSVVDNGLDASTMAKGLVSESEKLVNIADKVVEATINGMEYAISAVAGITTVLFYRIGQYIAGPFQIKSVNYDFDYNMVDEAGYPYKGNITLGLENIYRPDAKDIVAQAGYVVS